MEEPDLFEKLKQDKIYSILSGEKLGMYEYLDVPYIYSDDLHMPYISTQENREITERFGLETKQTTTQREWLNALFSHCIEQETCSNLLAYLFGKQRFKDMLSDHTPDAARKACDDIKKMALEKINAVLLFDDCELIAEGDSFYMKNLKEQHIQLHTPKALSIDDIKEQYERADADIDRGEYDSAITKSRSILERVLKYMLEKKKDEMKDYDAIMKSGRIKPMFNRVADLYDLKGATYADEYSADMIKDFEDVIDAIGKIRNTCGDAHGKGTDGGEPLKRHAALTLNAAITVSEYLLSITEETA